MNRGELVTELGDQGFQHVGTDRLRLFINQAAFQVHNEEQWSFRQVVRSGIPPLASSSIGPIENVQVTGQQGALIPIRRSMLVEAGYDLSAVSTPVYYYRTTDVGGGEAEPEIRTYPVSTVSIDVRHYTRSPWLAAGGSTPLRTPSADTDVPMLPEEYHDLIILAGKERAHEDNGDYDLATAVSQRLKVRMDAALSDLERFGVDEPDFIRLSEFY